MGIAELSRGISLGRHRVPLVRASLNTMDPHGHLENKAEFLVVSLVCFKVGWDPSWLEQGLGMKPKSWRKLGTRLAILREILHAIREQKKTKAGSSRQRKAPQWLIALKVRDRILWFLNNPTAVTLAVRDGDDGLKDFEWFLEEVQKDVEDPDKHLGPESPPTPNRPDVPAVMEVLCKSLKEHANCAGAWYLPSRCSLRVSRRTPKGRYDFCLGRRKRHTKRDAPEKDMLFAVFCLVLF